MRYNFFPTWFFSWGPPIKSLVFKQGFAYNLIARTSTSFLQPFSPQIYVCVLVLQQPFKVQNMKAADGAWEDFAALLCWLLYICCMHVLKPKTAKKPKRLFFLVSALAHVFTKKCTTPKWKPNRRAITQCFITASISLSANILST